MEEKGQHTKMVLLLPVKLGATTIILNTCSNPAIREWVRVAASAPTKEAYQALPLSLPARVLPFRVGVGFTVGWLGIERV